MFVPGTEHAVKSIHASKLRDVAIVAKISKREQKTDYDFFCKRIQQKNGDCEFNLNCESQGFDSDDKSEISVNRALFYQQNTQITASELI